MNIVASNAIIGLPMLVVATSIAAAEPQSYPWLELKGPKYWNGPIAVDNERIYLANSSGELRRGWQTGDPIATSAIAKNGWDCDSISVSGSKLYMIRKGSLVLGNHSTSPPQKTSVLGARGWSGSIATYGSTIFLARRGELLKGTISSNTKTTVIGSKGWDGDIAVDGSRIYLAHKKGVLRVGDISDHIVTRPVGKIPPNSRIAVRNGKIWVCSDGRLYVGYIRDAE